MSVSTPKSYAAFSDSELLEAIANGQKSALGELYDRYGAQLLGLAIKILQNRSLAEDVIQEVFVAIWQKADHYQNARGRASSWMTVMCRNRCIDTLRSRSRARKRAFDIEDEAFQQLPDQTAASPLENLAMSDQRSMVSRAMQELPPEQRSLIDLSYFQGLSQREIAEQLEIPLGTVKTRMRSGMQKLRTQLSEFFNQ